MSSFLRQGLLSVAVITSIASISSHTLAQTLFPDDTLFPGDRSARVAVLQQALQREGFFVTVDGVYGPATTAAVTQFQQRCGLIVDGIAGPQTNSALASGRCFGVPIQPPIGGIPIQPPIIGLPIQPPIGTPSVGPFVALVPGNNPTDLQIAQQVIPNARFDSSRLGSFINAGGYASREQAEQVVDLLRDRRLRNARVEFRP